MRLPTPFRVLVALMFVVCAHAPVARAADAPPYKVGIASVDVTPDYNVRLSGFGFRRAESNGVTQKIFAKALAFDDGTRGPAVLVTVDNLGIPDYMTREVAGRLREKAKLDPARLAITATHTHTAPMLTNVCPTLFGMPITPEHQANIDRYTKELTDQLEKVCLAALADLKPARVEFGVGETKFSINRRTPGGPVDHDVPTLAIRDADGHLRAIYVSYACHCVTLSHNKVSGDWAGYAAELLQASHPGAVVLTSVGCGADSNPRSNPVGDRVDVAQGQGKELADEVERLLKQGLAPLTGPVDTKLERITLPFDKIPTREEYAKIAERQDYAGYHARVQVARLDRGEKLQTELSYPIQTWTFGDRLAMVFLPGEVVVDYSLRLKRELDRSRLWINAYSNDLPCYIPSERVLKEGGYEGGGAMVYYDRPTRLAPGLEQKIIDEVKRQLPEAMHAPKGTEGVAAQSPADSTHAIRTKPGLEVELVAAEPLVASPVAIDWSADGRLWVCEMYDYPAGTDGNWRPGGRVKVLEDTDHDGKYDKATVFLENIPFPTGITAWGRGVLVCAAPDILYAEDTDNDGKADKIDKRFSGFATDNYQARVNSLSLGLDNWIYGANGLLGGVITGPHGKLDIRNRDFRFRPADGTMETATGITQQGRARDDFGRWFGCDNSRFLVHYPYEDRYLRRNPHVPSPNPVVAPPGDYDVARVFPASRTLQRFNDPGSANRVTSACGLGIYRDTLLGDAYYGNVFTAEPVHNLVHRMILTRGAGGDEDAPLKRSRATDESASEFLASTDNWFRPVQVRTGPDGALYVVDMYRFLIEHPRWIPAERLAELDVRAGADKGRIYRLKPVGKPLRDVRDLTKLSAADVAAAIDSPNGTDRDRVQIELLTRGDKAAVATLEKLAAGASSPQVRIQALSAVDGLGALTPAHVLAACKDPNADVRKQAVRAGEPLLAGSDELAAAVLALIDDPSHAVRRQVALTLGEYNDSRAGAALAKLAVASLNDSEIRAAVLSSATRYCGEILAAVVATDESTAGRAEWVQSLVATAAASGDDKVFAQALAAVLPAGDAAPTLAHFTALAGLMEALDRKHVLPSDYFARPELRDAGPRAKKVLDAARRLAADDAPPEPSRQAALRLLGRGKVSDEEMALLCRLAAQGTGDGLRGAALGALRRQRGPDVATRLLAGWRQTSPSARPEIVSMLLGRDEWTAALLDAVKKRTVQSHEISLTDRQRLTESADERVRKLAAEVFPPATSAGARAEVLDKYRVVATLTGNPATGSDVFAKNCSICHALGGVGHDVGPALDAVRNRDADYLLKNILDPNAVVEPRFISYQVVLNDGRRVSGVIKSETPTGVVIASGTAAAETVARTDIKEIRATAGSMMPEGLEAMIAPQQMADLIAYLRSSAPRKEFAGNAPAAVTPAADGTLLLPAAKAEIYGGPIVFETEYRNIGYWHGDSDHVTWNLRVDKPGDYDVYLDYACAADAAGNAYAIDIAGRQVVGKVTATGPDWSAYKQVKIGALHLDAGNHRLTMRPTGTLRGALADLRTIALAPAGKTPKWPTPAAQGVAALDEPARTPAAVARVILDAAKPRAAREAAVNANPQFAADLITEMTRDLVPGTPAEYQRIPWIWRVAIAAGRRNDAGQLHRLLDASLPAIDQPLRDWQAVVIGGGIINGISQQNVWPAPRIAEILRDDAPLQKRWQRSLDLAAAMADDAKVPTGTRYDALRMLGVEPWDKHGPHLAHYLAKEAELQMGAVSGLADVDSPHATAALLAALPTLTDGNRNLALDALLRDAPRANALLDAIDSKHLDPATLGPARIAKLTAHPDASVQRRSKALFTQATAK